ncbi:MAG: type I restriction endonuclease subunit M [Rhodoferax sp.]|nr:type I restriction endonuclease subunit M [Rhodoferax sp.]
MTTSFDTPPSPRREQLFLLGRIVATPGALELLRRTATNPEVLLMRHVTGDWGDIGAEDAQENELSLRAGFRLMSVYQLPLGTTAAPDMDQSCTAPLQHPIWLITEADRSVTTLLLPEEY